MRGLHYAGVSKYIGAKFLTPVCDERPRGCRMKFKKSLRPQRFGNVMKTSENIITT